MTFSMGQGVFVNFVCCIMKLNLDETILLGGPRSVNTHGFIRHKLLFTKCPVVSNNLKILVHHFRYNYFKMWG